MTVFLSGDFTYNNVAAMIANIEAQNLNLMTRDVDIGSVFININVKGEDIAAAELFIAWTQSSTFKIYTCIYGDVPTTAYYAFLKSNSTKCVIGFCYTRWSLMDATVGAKGSIISNSKEQAIIGTLSAYNSEVLATMKKLHINPKLIKMVANYQDVFIDNQEIMAEVLVANKELPHDLSPSELVVSSGEYNGGENDVS